MPRYVKKGGWGGGGRNAGRKTLSKRDRLGIVGRCQIAWEALSDAANRLRPSKRLLANWTKLNKLPLQYRKLVLQLVDQNKDLQNVPVVVRDAVVTLKKTRAIIEERGRIRPRARPYGKREQLIKRIATEESARRMIDISWRQVRRWWDDSENLI